MPHGESEMAGAIEQLILHGNSPSGIEDNEHLQTVLNTLPVAIYTTDTDGLITFYNEAAVRLWGCRPALHSDKWCGSWRLYWPDGTPLPHDSCPMAIALKEKRAISGQEAVAERPDGTRVSFMAFPSPLRNSTGAIIGAVNMLVDITERKGVEEIGQRLASIVESSHDAIISKDLNGIIKTWNKGAERLFGYVASEIIGKPVLVLIPQHLQHQEQDILGRIRRGERIDHYETIRRRKDGGLVEISLTVSPVKDANGGIVGASKIARDISEQKRAEERIGLLAREVDHRAKNVLALVQATVHLTQASTVEDFKEAIDGRLQAIANAHTFFTASHSTGADLHALLSTEFALLGEDSQKCVKIDGASLTLEPSTAQSMAVIVHELTTNSVKYGALSVAGGGVQVEWSDDARGFVFCWSESGGPSISPPRHRGFGTRVIEQMVRSQMKGDVSLDWREQGLVCKITVPRLPAPE